MLAPKDLCIRSIVLALLLSLAVINAAYSADIFTFNKNLTLGSNNNDVRQLQKYLNSNGFVVAKTGPGSINKETTLFGRATRAALIKFQQANNIKPASGYFGPLTRRLINVTNLLDQVGDDSSPRANNQFNNIDNNFTAYTIGGTITGLGGPVTIQNNNNLETITVNPGNNSEFTFPTKLNSNSNYTITIKQNYLGQSCFIKDNTGIVTNSNITNIKIACGISLYFNPFTRVANSTLAQFNISYAAGANGSIAGDTSQVVTLNNDASMVTAIPNTGYHFVEWSDGLLTASRTDANIVSNKSTTASFAINTYTLTSSAGANGTITATDTVNYGSNKTFTITPDEGYIIEDVLVDGSSVGTDSTYTFMNVTTSHTISATFIVESYYTVSVSSGPNGAISPATVNVGQGLDKTFTITPSSAYHIYDVLVDGTSVGTPSSYTFTNVTSNHAILALFVVDSCGDATVQLGEECDEGDSNGGETCTLDCRIPSTCGGYILYDWKYYSTVKIGNQCWFSENLAYLPSVSTFNTVDTDSAHYYVYDYSGTDVAAAKEASDYNTYGVLYNYPAMLTACPSGWHVPDDTEWITLENYLGGADVASNELRESGVTHWETPNTGATNSSGFSALPGGRLRRHYFPQQIFQQEYRNTRAYFWSSTDGMGIIYRYLVFSDPVIYTNNPANDDALSIRCIQDSIPE